MNSCLILALLKCAAVPSLPAIRSGQPWHDTNGAVINAHGGGMLAHGGRFYWYGSVRCSGCAGSQMNGGINLYSSADLYTWEHEGLVLRVFNGSATGNGLDLERPKVVHCAGTGKFVMWVRGTGFGNTPQLLAVATADAPVGPFTFVGNATDPFHTVFPGNGNLPGGQGYQYADATLYQDQAQAQNPNQSRTFVYWRTRVNPQNTGFRAMELTPDCLDVVPGSDTQLFATPNREAPAVFAHGSTYYLWTSGTMGWSPTDVFLYAADAPLGNFSASSQPGHGWHTYTKASTGGSAGSAGWAASSSGNNWTMWAARDGYLPMGDVWGNESQQNTTLRAAQAACGASDACKGFCFQDWLRTPPPTQPIRVAFKTAAHFVPEDSAAGIQPPPIAPPGRRGNTQPAQPGEWAFGSQSTYIFPNPAYTAGSALPQFIYMGDRWNYSSAHGTSRATYVWLPLFVDELDPSKVQVVWYDSWRLDNVTSPFVEARA